MSSATDKGDSHLFSDSRQPLSSQIGIRSSVAGLRLRQQSIGAVLRVREALIAVSRKATIGIVKLDVARAAVLQLNVKEGECQYTYLAWTLNHHSSFFLTW